MPPPGQPQAASQRTAQRSAHSCRRTCFEDGVRLNLLEGKLEAAQTTKPPSTLASACSCDNTSPRFCPPRCLPWRPPAPPSDVSGANKGTLTGWQASTSRIPERSKLACLQPPVTQDVRRKC